MFGHEGTMRTYQKDVDKEVGTATALKEDTDWRQDDSEARGTGRSVGCTWNATTVGTNMICEKSVERAAQQRHCCRTYLANVRAGERHCCLMGCGVDGEDDGWGGRGAVEGGETAKEEFIRARARSRWSPTCTPATVV